MKWILLILLCAIFNTSFCAVRWVRKYEISSSDAYAYDIVEGEDDGSLYVLGQCEYGGSKDVFIAKFTSYGKYVWSYIRRIESVHCEPRGIAINPKGNRVAYSCQQETIGGYAFLHNAETGNMLGEWGTTSDVIMGGISYDNYTSGWIIAYSVSSSGTYTPSLTRFDYQLDIVDSKTFDTSSGHKFGKFVFFSPTDEHYYLAASGPVNKYFQLYRIYSNLTINWGNFLDVSASAPEVRGLCELKNGSRYIMMGVCENGGDFGTCVMVTEKDGSVSGDGLRVSISKNDGNSIYPTNMFCSNHPDEKNVAYITGTVDPSGQDKPFVMKISVSSNVEILSVIEYSGSTTGKLPYSIIQSSYDPQYLYVVGNRERSTNGEGFFMMKIDRELKLCDGYESDTSDTTSTYAITQGVDYGKEDDSPRDFSPSSITGIDEDWNKFTLSSAHSPACYYCSSIPDYEMKNVCSFGRGLCIGTDHCQCTDHWKGSNCSVGECFGKLSNSSSEVCSGRGNCVDLDVCSCTSNYYGKYCNVTTCKDIFSNETGKVCLGHGECVSFDNCTCNGDYASTGSSCEYKATCFGIPYNMSEFACNGHGKCVGDDVCRCFENYFGKYCNVTTCFEKWNNVTGTMICSGHGTCRNNDHCECEVGKYYGKYCSITTCNSVFSNSSAHMVCSGHGMCGSYNNCTCVSKEYYPSGPGKFCQFWDCFNERRDNTSVCNFQNGTCSSSNNCTCNHGYSGEKCEIWKCNGVLYNDTKNVCYGHGECTNSEICKCKLNYFPGLGAGYCNDWKCHGHMRGSAAACNYKNGTCIDHNKCNCSSGYYGPNCDIWDCNGYIRNHTSVCNSKGVCQKPESCVCYSGVQFEGKYCGKCTRGWHGKGCDVSMCFGVLGNYTASEGIKDPKTGNFTCSGKGRCETPDRCVCDMDDLQTYAKYGGKKCDIPNCFLVSRDSDGVCSGHGKCEDFNLCDCEFEYFGSNCMERFTRPEFTGGLMNRLEMSYFLSRTEFLNAGKMAMTKEKFNCSLILENWSPFFAYNSSYCSFEFLEIVSDVFFATDLILHLIDEKELSELSQKEKKKEGGRREPPPPVNFIDVLKLPENFTLRIITVTKPEQIVPIEVIPFNSPGPPPNHNPPPGPGPDKESTDGTIVDDLLPLFISLPVFLLFLTFLFVVSAICVILGLICVFFCCCCFVVCGVCCVVFCCCCGTCCLSAMLWRQRKKITKFGKLQNFDLLLREQEMAMDTSQAHLRINQKLFEIPFDEIKTESILGEGGSNSVVFKAKWNKRIVAFKCFKTRQLMSDQDRFDEFEKEVELMASLSHPYIIRFFGATMKMPRIGIVMEYCSNGEIFEYMEKFKEMSGSSYPNFQKIRMLCQIANALDFLHSRNIIHRDLKSENVLIDEKEDTRLMDFGLSRMIDRMSVKKTTRVGTNVYMAPEIVTSSKYTEKCDVFSFAILMYILFTEDLRPYGKKAMDRIEMKVANNPSFRPSMERLSEVLEGSSYEWVKDLIVLLWNHDPEERLSCREITERLEHQESVRRKSVRKEEEGGGGKKTILFKKDEKDAKSEESRFRMEYQKLEDEGKLVDTIMDMRKEMEELKKRLLDALKIDRKNNDDDENEEKDSSENGDDDDDDDSPDHDVEDW